MKKIALLILTISAALNSSAQQYGSLWRFNNSIPTSKPVLNATIYKTVTTDEQALSAYLSTVGNNAYTPTTISLPAPDGSTRAFYIWETDIMERPLAQKYSSIHTYTASAVDNHLVTAKIDYTQYGFHAMIADGENSFFIDPYGKTANGSYISYYRANYRGNAPGKAACGVGEEGGMPGADPTYLTNTGLPPVRYRINGSLRRTYRLALACTGEYAVAVAGPSPNKADVLAKMITTLNRVNSVYERDLAITMQLVANDDTLIFLNPSTDPYSDANAFAMLTQNQSTIDARIKTANYDIGHVLGTGGGGTGTGLGYAAHGTCQAGLKAQGATGRPSPLGDAFDIDFVAHEMGHQYGAEHTFNNTSNGACNIQTAVAGSAYEPGSGSTVMAYAGICGIENIQNNSDAYFHSRSLEEITTYVIANTCAIVSVSGNVNASVPPFAASYSIPYLTAFELTAPEVIDPTADAITYCWEQRDLGDFGKSISQTRLYGPQFRSFNPSTSRTRLFPSIDSLLKSVFISKQEKIADTARTFSFRLTERDIFQGYGCFNFPDDSIFLNVVNTGSPFKVLLPNASVSWPGGSTQTVTWNVGGTNVAPINCTNVDIFLSTDGGYTFPVTLAANTANDGSEAITLPNVNTSNMRIKIKGVGNVFLAISHTTPPTSFKHPIPTPGVNITPVPAFRQVEVQFIRQGESSFARVVNTAGQLVWSGNIVDREVIDVSTWAKGIYFLKLMNENSIDIVRPIIVE